jgi:hypothetical protein
LKAARAVGENASAAMSTTQNATAKVSRRIDEVLFVFIGALILW